jgi:hypothetical protein
VESNIGRTIARCLPTILANVEHSKRKQRAVVLSLKQAIDCRCGEDVAIAVVQWLKQWITLSLLLRVVLHGHPTCGQSAKRVTAEREHAGQES